MAMPPNLTAASLLYALLLFAMPLFPQQPPPSGIAIDHVILGINNLERGIEEFNRRTGVAPQRGGRHPGRGTENALLSLGEDHYLEILAATEPPSDPVRAARVGYERLTPSGWALHTGNLPGVIARLRAAGFTVPEPSPGSRRRPDGTLLEWQSVAAEGPGLELAPFFIQWSPAGAHPSATSPGGCRLVRLQLIEPQPARLRAFFAAIGFPTMVDEGPGRDMRLTLDCPQGQGHVSFSRR
jgi:hypothetical protein